MRTISLKPEERSSLGKFLQRCKSECDSSESRNGTFRNGTGTGDIGVPEEIGTELLSRALRSSVLAGRCTRIPRKTGRLLNLPMIDESSRENGSRYGGVSAAWLSESEEYTLSTPTVDNTRRELDKVGAAMASTEELLFDADALESVAYGILSSEVAFKLDEAIFSGNGIKKPLGVLHSDAAITVDKQDAQTAGTIVHENLTSMLARLDDRSASGAVWLANMKTIAELHSTKLDGVAVVGSRPEGSYLTGFPIIPFESCSELGTVGDIALVNLREYVLQIAPELFAMSAHTKFLTDQVVFKLSIRLSGQPVWKSPVTHTNGGRTVSPFILLQTRD